MLALPRLLSSFVGTALLCACPNDQFWCQREPETEGQARRCQRSQDGCEKYLALKPGGCDATTSAWCFHEKPVGNFPPELVCAATEQDCTQWRRTRSKYQPTECALTSSQR